MNDLVRSWFFDDLLTRSYWQYHLCIFGLDFKYWLEYLTIVSDAVQKLYRISEVLDILDAFWNIIQKPDYDIYVIDWNVWYSSHDHDLNKRLNSSYLGVHYSGGSNSKPIQNQNLLMFRFGMVWYFSDWYHEHNL